MFFTQYIICILLPINFEKICWVRDEVCNEHSGKQSEKTI